MEEIQIPSDDAHLEAKAFLRALLEGDRLGAIALARAVFPHGVAYLYEQVVRPAMVEIGALWHANRITVANEHIATAIAQSAVAALYPDFPWQVGGPTALIACVEGERHEFGARMVADLLAINGWHTHFLGADTPASALLDLAIKLSPELVALSVSLPLHLHKAREVTVLLKEKLPQLKVLAGGHAVVALPDAVDRLGVDRIARSAAGAVEVARPWMR